MSTTFRPYAPDQMLLLPADLRAWLPEGHLAHHVSDLVDGVDLTAFYAPYAGDGRRNAPYAPRMMVKVLLWRRSSGQRTTPAVGSRTKTGTRRAGSPTSGRMASRTLRRRATSRTRRSSREPASVVRGVRCVRASRTRPARGRRTWGTRRKEGRTCEWRKVVNNPELRRKFQQFVNTDETEVGIEFIDERGMQRPKLLGEEHHSTRRCDVNMESDAQRVARIPR